MANLHGGDNLVGQLSGIGSLNGSLSGIGSLNGSLGIPSKIEGTRDYEKLINKPSIESVELIGNKDFPDLGLDVISTEDLLEILN